MEKILIFLGVLLLSSPANAEWTWVFTSPTGSDEYLDFDSMRKNGGYRYIWHLSNYLKPTESGISSATFYEEVDCQRYGLRALQTNIYNQFMGEGPAKGTQTHLNENFMYPKGPDSVIAHFIKLTCEH